MTPDPPPMPVPRVLLPRSRSMLARPSALSQGVSPEQLRMLVLEYLEHNCYGRTLGALRRDLAVVAGGVVDKDKGKGKALPVSADEPGRDADDMLTDVEDERSSDDEKDGRTQLRLRTEIRSAILAGDIPRTTSLLESHFPSVLSSHSTASPTSTPNPTPNPTANPNPSASSNPKSKSKPPPWIPSVAPNHISLNLRIQSFIESLHPSPSYNIASSIAAGRKLQAEVTALSDVAYTAEWALVGALLAYADPLRSAPAPMRRYMLPGRRMALADQVDRAVLWSLGISPATRLETSVRHNAAVWSTAHEMRLPLDAASIPAGIAPPTPFSSSLSSSFPLSSTSALPLSSSQSAPVPAQQQQVVPLFDFHEWLKARKDREREAGKDKTGTRA